MLDNLTIQTAGWAMEDAARAKDFQTAALLVAFHTSDPKEVLDSIRSKWRGKNRREDPLQGWTELGSHMRGKQGGDMVKQLHDNLEGARLLQAMREKKNG